MEPDRPTHGTDVATSPTVALGPHVRLVADSSPDVVGLAVLTAGRLGAELDTDVGVVQVPDVSTGPAAGTADDVTTVRLRLVAADSLGLPPGPTAREQGFRLSVGPHGVDVAAADPTGLAHAVATLVRVASTGRSRADRAARRAPRLPVRTVVDHPWVAWRGVGVDLAAEPLGTDGVRALLAVMSALRLGVLRLPRLDLAAPAVLGGVGYGEVAAAAASRRMVVVPGASDGSDPSAVGDLVAATRARWVDVGGRSDDPRDVRARVDAAASAGAGALVDQAAAGAVVGVPDVVLLVRDTTAADDVAAVRRAVVRGARVLLVVPRRAVERPLVPAAAAVDRSLAALDLPDGALLGVEAGPGPVQVAPPGTAADTYPGTLLPWMAAIAEIGWTAPA